MIINFLLFKLAFMILPVLALISGGMFYLGMNGKDTIPTIKKCGIRGNRLRAHVHGLVIGLLAAGGNRIQRDSLVPSLLIRKISLPLLC